MNEKEIFENMGFDTSALVFDDNGVLLSTPLPQQTPSAVDNVVNPDVIREIVRGVMEVQSEMATEEPSAVPTEEPSPTPTVAPTTSPTCTPVPFMEKPISQFDSSEVLQSIGVSVLCVLLLVVLFGKFWR